MSRTRCSALRAAPQSRDRSFLPCTKWAPVQLRSIPCCAASGERPHKPVDDRVQAAAHGALSREKVYDNCVTGGRPVIPATMDGSDAGLVLRLFPQGRAV